MSEESDIVGRAGRGDREAVSDLYLSLRDPVNGLCARLLPADGQAEEAAADVLLRLEQLARTYNASISFKGWVLRAVSNHCIDLLRRRQLERRWVVPDEGQADSRPGTDPSVLATLLTQEQHKGVQEAMQRLPDLYRLVIVLRYYQDLSYDEIARQLQIPRATVGTSLFRAKALLRARLTATGPAG